MESNWQEKLWQLFCKIFKICQRVTRKIKFIFFAKITLIFFVVVLSVVFTLLWILDFERVLFCRVWKMTVHAYIRRSNWCLYKSILQLLCCHTYKIITYYLSWFSFSFLYSLCLDHSKTKMIGKVRVGHLYLLV